MDWLSVVKSVAPTVATAVLGPLGGVAVSAIGNALGVSDATQEKIAEVIKSAAMTPEQMLALKKLELDFQAKEQEMGVRFVELEFQDRDSARKANVAGGVQENVFWLSIVLLIACLSCEMTVLFKGYPDSSDPLVVGRVLGVLDSIVMIIMAYWYGTSNGSAVKTSLLAQNGNSTLKG